MYYFRSFNKETKVLNTDNYEVLRQMADSLTEKESVFVFSQATGMTDFHGNMIFEGDILESDATRFGVKCKYYQVVGNKEIHYDDMSEYFGYEYFESSCYTVVGNIYQDSLESFSKTSVY